MRPSSRELVARLGGHPAASLGIDLGEEAGVVSWLVAACLLAARVDERRALAAHRALRDARLDGAREIAAASPPEVERTLAGVGYPQAEVTARRLGRACAALAERYRGSFAALAADAENTEDLAIRVAALAPGIGRATVARFLRPLRDLWPAARETPMAPAARAAALHLGWLRGGEDEEGEPAALRGVLARERAAPALADVEAALERLGERACLRERVERCPLADRCPVRR